MTADEMFEELGYKIKRNDELKIVYKDEGNKELYIVFDKESKFISGFPTYDCFCDMSILKAINKKVE